MKNLKALLVLAALTAFGVFGQTNTMTVTTTAAAQTNNSRTISLTSATGIVAPSGSTLGTQLYVIDPGQTEGEIEEVLSIASTVATVKRTSGRTQAHASGSLIIAGQPQWFYKYNPTGSCVTATTFVTPWVNTITGQQWLCSTKTLTWVPGWGNMAATPQVITATATASVAGATAIAAPLVHISGTNAITSFTMGIGWQGNNFCVVPDAAFTTTATNNIAIASTAVANKTLCFTWDSNAAKFTASY